MAHINITSDEARTIAEKIRTTVSIIPDDLAQQIGISEKALQGIISGTATYSSVVLEKFTKRIHRPDIYAEWVAENTRKKQEMKVRCQNIGALIQKTRCETLGVKAKQLAEQAGVSRSWLDHVEGGRFDNITDAVESVLKTEGFSESSIEKMKKEGAVDIPPPAVPGWVEELKQRTADDTRACE